MPPPEEYPVDESGYPFYGGPDRPTKASVGGAYLWWALFGAFGGHRYYLGRTSASTLCTITGVHLAGALVVAAGGSGGPTVGLSVAGSAALALVVLRVLFDLFSIPGVVGDPAHREAG